MMEGDKIRGIQPDLIGEYLIISGLKKKNMSISFFLIIGITYQI